MNAVCAWWDDAADGPTNMAIDELLAAEAIRRDALLLRFYRWSSAAVSLGAFQSLAAAEASGEIRGLPLVRRPSGGGAIVHGSDLTYAAAVPKSYAWGRTPQSLYDALHGALVRALAEAGIVAVLWTADAASGPAPAAGAEATALFCFDRRAAGDVVMRRADPATAGRGCKIMGSAQRRLDRAVLQHGSLLVRRNEAVVGAGHPGLGDLHPGLVTSDAFVRTLTARWAELVAAGLEADLAVQPGPFRGGFAGQIEERAARFRDPRWTARR